MAKGVNGTIDNSTQTNVQRNTQTNRNNNSGISSRLGVANDTYYSSSTGLFPDSPVNNIEKRDYIDPEDRGNLFRGDPDIYNVYKEVVDREAYAVGYGFDGNSSAYMNYSHPENPFIVDGILNLDLLKSGESHVADNKIINYRGVPDPVVNDINDPETEIDNSDDLSLGERKNNDLYGSESSEYRKSSQTSLITNSDDSSSTYNDSIDTIGKYFTNNY